MRAQDLVLQADNCIRVWNNGDGVPVEVHKEEKVYVPELIFGHLLTSSNYDDNEQKVAVAINRLVCSARFELLQLNSINVYIFML